MTKLNQVFKCSVCGNVVETVHSGAGVLVCCNKNMNLMLENEVDASTEKHVPIIKKTENGVKVVVGSVEHPMDENHFIEWIEIIANGIVFRKFLKPGEKPEAEFCVIAKNIEARAYCNLHGLWKTQA